MFKEIDKCLICGNTNLIEIINLGEQSLTGVFPRRKVDTVTKGPLTLVKCMGGDSVCGLVQLKHIYNIEEMYGNNYGYRSGLNKSMIQHLHRKVDAILKIARLEKDDLIIDIGSNDSTTLQAYPAHPYVLVGIDPTGVKFHQFYPAHIKLIPDFFSSRIIMDYFGDRKAKIVTSFAMFYDLEDPLRFMQEIYDILNENGIWVFEQSYMPAMLEMNAYDTICHEHLEYYALRQIKWMTDRVGFKIIQVEMNDINGGSFSVTVAKEGSPYPAAPNLGDILQDEEKTALSTLRPYRQFAERVKEAKRNLLLFIDSVKKDGKTLYGLGASTKGNVILQYCGITERDIPFIGEINRDKIGCRTSGSFIPIISEEAVLEKQPDYLLVLPWHFKSFFENQQKFKNTKLVFPLPKLTIIN